uniref:Uncharacterized protein n=1 Tax=Vitis vinifera TaxID=29760 RepID=A5B399_VITVI|nr:hypothetical protein VITISV_042684 [Vitis vinifera]
MSSWGIRMELIRIALHAPCHPGEGSLHLAHANGPPCDIAHSTRGRILSGRLSTFSGYFTSGIPSADVSPSLDISHSDGRGGRFNFSGKTCPDPLIALTRRASAAANSDFPDSLARQTLAIFRIHFRPQ